MIRMLGYSQDMQSQIMLGYVFIAAVGAVQGRVLYATVLMCLFFLFKWLRTRLSKTFRIPYKTILFLQLAFLLLNAVSLILFSYPTQNYSLRHATRRPITRRFTNQLTKFLAATNLTSLPPSDHPELRNWNRDDIIERLPKIFDVLPEQFLEKYVNPCWYDKDQQFVCLPRVHLIGMPKCGTSDLYERIIKHPHVVAPQRKEIRWFTRGEFSDADGMFTPLRDDHLHTYLRHFTKASKYIEDHPEAVTIDGGPHTLWWPIQLPSGLIPDDIPVPQILKVLQPSAKFIITLQNPVHRTYSDYYFLADDKKPVYNRENEIHKSAEEFHQRVVEQVDLMNQCISHNAVKHGWFRASQICAHDRHTFGKAGWGRVCIGMYIAFLAKWIPLFDRSSFLILRMEDFDADPRGHMRTVFQFLDLQEPNEQDWDRILFSFRANSNPVKKEHILPQTQELLTTFFEPYNRMLANCLKDDRFMWSDTLVEPKTDVVHIHHKNNIHAPEGLMSRLFANDNHPSPDHDALQNGVRHPVQMSSGVKLNYRKLPGKVKPRSGWNEFARMIVEEPLEELSPSKAAGKICAAAFSLEIGAVHEVLKAYGAHVNEWTTDRRQALHCLASLFTMADSFPGSYVFNLLRGRPGWLGDMFNPALPSTMTSVANAQLMLSMQVPIVNVGQWLLAAGADVNALDGEGHTPLIIAAIGGLTDLTQLLLKAGAQPNYKGPRGMTPLHWAGVLGHAETASILLKNGADGDMACDFGYTFNDLARVPGPIHPDLAKRWLDIDQDIPKRIPPPSSFEDNGGWGEEVLDGYENVLTHTECDIDMFYAHELDSDTLFKKYLAMNRPVLIRGLLNEWPAKELYTVDSLREHWGDLMVHVSSIPYAGKFASDPAKLGVDMSLEDYIDAVLSHTLVGDRYPWYVFKPFPLPSAGDKEDSPVRHDFVPTPPILEQAFQQGTRYSQSGKKVEGGDTRAQLFVNAQWAVGVEGSGAPVHFHNTAFNALVYGIKKWFVFPPSTRIMSNSQIRLFVEKELPTLSLSGSNALTCVQHAGDVMIIPESWGHGVLNLQESVCVATEARASLFRLPHLPSPVALNEQLRKSKK